MDERLKKSYWNYRLVDHGRALEICEVHYEADGSIYGYTSILWSETVEGIECQLKKMQEALIKPVLTAKDLTT